MAQCFPQNCLAKAIERQIFTVNDFHQATLLLARYARYSVYSSSNCTCNTLEFRYRVYSSSKLQYVIVSSSPASDYTAIL